MARPGTEPNVGDHPAPGAARARARWRPRRRWRRRWRVRGSDHRRERHATDVDGDVGGLVAPQWRLHLAREWSPPVDPFIHQGEVGGIDLAFDVRPGDRPGRGEHRLHRAHATGGADRSRSTRPVQIGTGCVAGDEPSEALRGRAQHQVELVGKGHPPTAAPGAFAGHHRADGEHESRPQPVALEVLAAQLETAVAGAHQEAR